MPAENVTYTANWILCPVTLEKNISTAGSITMPKTTVIGQALEIGATTNLGYTWMGWFIGKTEITKDLSYTFDLSMEDITYTAKWQVNEELGNFIFTSTVSMLTITGIKDKDVATIIVPDYVTSISGGAFSGCGNLTSIVLPFIGNSSTATVASNETFFGYIFGKSAYDGGQIIEQYKAVNGIVRSASYCIPISLTSVTITNGIILDGAFSRCSNLTSIEIPSNITSIGAYAFYYCSSLMNIEISDSVTSIGRYAFYNCSGAKIVWISNNVTSIEPYAFNNDTIIYCEVESNPGWSGWCTGDCSVRWNCKKIDSIIYQLEGDIATVVRQQSHKIMGDVIIPSFIICNNIRYTVASIGNGAFSGCCGLTSIIIPNSITNIVMYSGSISAGEIGVFNGCTSLTTITVESGNSKYHSAGNCIIETDSRTLIAGCKNSSIPSDGSVTSIDRSAFNGCSSLTNIEIPSSITCIDVGTFERCSSLTSITIPSSVTKIESYAFRYCRSLTSINFGGTENQWKAIEKGFESFNQTGSYTVIYSDSVL